MTTVHLALRLLSMMDRRWVSLPVVVGLGLVAALAEGIGLSLFIPLVQMLSADQAAPMGGPIGFLVDQFNAVPESYRLQAIVGTIVGFIVLKNVVSFVNHYVWQYNETMVAHNLRTRIFAESLRSAPGSDPDTAPSRSDLANLVTNEAWRVGSALSLVLFMMVSALTCLVFLVFMFLISVEFTVVTLVCLVLIAAIAGFVNKQARAVGSQSVEANKRFHARLWESVYAMKLIRSFGREDYEKERYQRGSDNIRRNFLKLSVISTIPDLLTEILATGLIAIMLLIFARDPANLPQLVAILVIILRIQRPARSIMSSRAAFEGCTSAVKAVFDYLASGRKPGLASGNKPIDSVRHGIAFENVSYRYAKEGHAALSDVTFSIAAGSTTAIVGPSGAGKSTLLDLVFRFQDPTGGRIIVDGTPLTDIDLAVWRSRLAIVSQEAYFFDESVAANIAYGKPGASQADVERAARLAQAHTFIERLPGGYDANLGELGDKLSGGQRQRVALARAIVREPDILLLDEPTNALDSVAEQAFLEALRGYADARTVVIVAHRLSMIEWVDNIAVIDDGKLVENGTFDELVHADGVFAHLYRSQRLP